MWFWGTTHGGYHFGFLIGRCFCAWCHFRSIATAPCVVQPLPFLGRLVCSRFFPRKDGGGERLKANQRHADMCRQHLWYGGKVLTKMANAIAFRSYFLFLVSSHQLKPYPKKKKDIKQDFTPRWIWRLSLNWSQASSKENGMNLWLNLFFVAPLLNLCLKKISSDVFVFHDKVFVIGSKKQRLFAPWAGKTRLSRFDNLPKTRRYTHTNWGFLPCRKHFGWNLVKIVLGRKAPPHQQNRKW